MNKIWEKPTYTEKRIEDYFQTCGELVINILRQARFYPEKIKKNYKKDWSIFTNYDILLEEEIKKLTSRFFSEFSFIGEENWWLFEEKWICVAIDPIDATNNFVNHDKTCAFSLTVFYNWKIFAWLIINPATWEIFFAIGNKKTRLIQLWLNNQSPLKRTLPSNKEKNNTLLVDLQYSTSTKTAEILYKWIVENEIETLRSTKGSPALNMAESAKWFYMYVCDWTGDKSKAYDLSAGYKIIKNAWWAVIDLNTLKEINPIGFNWTFVTGIYKDKIFKLINILWTCQI